MIARRPRPGGLLPVLLLLLLAPLPAPGCGGREPPAPDAPAPGPPDGEAVRLADAMDRARACKGAGDGAGEERAWEEVLGLRPDHAGALFASATHRCRAGDPATALRRLAALREAEPGGGRGFLLASEILGDPAAGSLRDPPGAVAMAEAALARNPEESGTHLALGKALLLAGRLPDAGERLAVAARMNPRDADSRSLLGVLALRGGRPEEARARFREACHGSPGTGVGALHGGVPGEGDTEAALDPGRAPTPGELRGAAGLWLLGTVVRGAEEGDPLSGEARERVRAALAVRGTGESPLDLDGDGVAEGVVVEGGHGLGVALHRPGEPVRLHR